MRPAEDFDPSFKMGWNEEGLLVMVEVPDDVVIVDPDRKRLWRKDCIEIFVGLGPGSGESYQVTLAPSPGDGQGPWPVFLADNRKKLKKQGKLSAIVKGSRSATGYIAEVLLPWKQLGLQPTEGLEVGVQGQGRALVVRFTQRLASSLCCCVSHGG